MTDLHERFAQLDDIEVEDLWREIELRFEDDVERVIGPIDRPRRRFAVAAAAAFLLAILLGAAILMAQFQEEEPPIITQVPTPTSLPSPTSTMPETDTTLPESTTGTLADILNWSVATLPGEVTIDCSSYERQHDPLCTTPFGAVLQDVIVAGNRLIAVGHDGSTGQWRGVIFTSGDGEDWSRAQGPGTESSLGNEDIRAVAIGGNMLVAVGARDCNLIDPTDTSTVESCPLVWISKDGDDWESVGLDAIRTSGGSPFATAITEGEFAPDTSYGPADYGMNDVEWTGNQFVAAGHAIWTSADGRTWTMASLPSNSVSSSGECSPQCWANAVLVTGEAMVAGGKDPTLKASPQGGKASLWLSTDGLTWSQFQPDLPEYAEFSDVVATNDRYIAIGVKGGDEGGVFTATTDDVLDWSDMVPVRPLGSADFFTGRQANGAVVDGERIVAVGYQYPVRYLTEGGAARVWVSLSGGTSWEVYPFDDMAIFGDYYSSTATADMRASTLFDDRIVVVGRYYTNAAVWVGTWTD